MFSSPMQLPDLPSGWQWDAEASRQSRRLRMTVDANRLTVRLRYPLRTTGRAIQRFLESHDNWLQERLIQVELPQPLSDGQPISLFGVTYRLSLSDQLRGIVEVEGDCLHVPGGPAHQGARLKRYIQQQLKQWAEAELAQLCSHIGHDALPGIAFPEMHSRWGSCSPHRNHIRLNWRLALAPVTVLHYVLAHEVAHLRHGDHSPAFWQLTQRLTPASVPRARRWLRNHGHELYRTAL